MIFNPRPYQNLIIDHILRYDRAAIWASMGMGKTSATLYALDTLKMVENNNVLIIAPLRVARSVWPEEVKKWDVFSHLKVVPILGDPKERYFAMKEPADIHTINYENIGWLAGFMVEHWKWGTVVADESTRLKSFRLNQGGKRARALSKITYTHIKRFIELTGTPSPNGLKDLWGQLWFMDKGSRLGRSYTAFMQRWFRLPHPNAFEWEPMPHAQAEIESRVKDICLSVQAKDWFDLREPIITEVPIELPAKAREIYTQMERDMFAEITKNESIEAMNAAAKTMKCLQLANGAAYTDDTSTTWAEVHDEKLNALEEIIDEAAGMPIIVSYHFKSDLARLKKRFAHGIELDQKQSTINKWNAGKIQLLFAHPASAGHGLNLQSGGNIIAFFGHWWDLEQYMQIIERIGPTRQLQAGYDRPVYIYNIMARRTVDELVIQRRTDKRRVQDLLLEAARRR